jgi:hypothetical protein
MKLPEFTSVYGVDFSGARKAGLTTWVARAEPRRSRPGLALVELHRLDTLCGTSERAACLGHLVRMVNASAAALWGIDAPFGLPVELFPTGATWFEQFEFLAEWGDDAYGCGLECIRRARRVGDRMHIRRTTDTETKAPFDSYHYRVVYQMFHGMRDVARPLSTTPRTAVLPFQYRKLSRATRVVVECCPSSVLKKLGLPHQNYKQPTGGPLTRKRRTTRRAILAGLAKLVRIGDRHRRAIMRNPGGDALDAVITAVGAFRGVTEADHATIARHDRYPREGFLFA